MELPIPTHLQKYFTPIGENNNEYEVTGNIHCTCNGEEFQVFESNDKEIIKVVCKKCNQEILLFDAGKYGWNGYVCKDDFLDRQQPFHQKHCFKCQGDFFEINRNYSVPS